MLQAIDTPSTWTAQTTQYRRRSIPLRRQYYSQTTTRRFATAALSTPELQQQHQQQHQQQRVCTTTTKKRRELVPQPSDLHGPFSTFNISHQVDFVDLERAIRNRQAESAWSLFTTLASRPQGEDERYIPLPLCSALFSLLTFAKTLSGRGKASDYRQKQIDQLLHYVVEEFEMPRSQFMAGAQVIPIPPHKILLNTIRRRNKRASWGIFYDMTPEQVREMPRNMIFKLMSLLQDDFKIDHKERMWRLEFVAGLHEGIVDNGRALTAMEILDIAKVYHLFETDDPRAAHGMMMQLNKGDSPISSAVLAELVWRAIEFKALNSAKELLLNVSERRKEQGEPLAADEPAYISLIHAFRDKKQYIKALELFELILEEGIPPSIRGFNAALQVFADQGQADKSVYVFNSLIELGIVPDAATFSEMIKAHTIAGDMRAALEYYHIMREEYSIQPNAYTYSIIIEAFSKRNDAHSVIRWFQSMLRHDIFPNHIIMNNAIKAFQRQSKAYPNMGEAVARIVGHAKASGIKADAHLYTLLLQVQGQINGLGGALATHREMIARLIEPNVYTYTTLIYICGQHDAPDAAHQIFELMKQSRVYLPNTHTYSAMMDVLSKAQRHDVLKELIQEFLVESQKAADNNDCRLLIDPKVRGYIQLYT
ncbi:hypothetical protein INT45_009586 [Circinella minor]|uniref:PROP1-like PPR domain-containing protein n=1 Tax=Circinella minor TaxID=1195481 RepID=A0A8H7VKJ5_9FUNG|nr:hypothetical protein INT45_009586 [Circinella minor]